MGCDCGRACAGSGIDPHSESNSAGACTLYPIADRHGRSKEFSLPVLPTVREQRWAERVQPPVAPGYMLRFANVPHTRLHAVSTLNAVDASEKLVSDSGPLLDEILERHAPSQEFGRATHNGPLVSRGSAITSLHSMGFAPTNLNLLNMYMQIQAGGQGHEVARGCKGPCTVLVNVGKGLVGKFFSKDAATRSKGNRDAVDKAIKEALEDLNANEQDASPECPIPDCGCEKTGVWPEPPFMMFHETEESTPLGTLYTVGVHVWNYVLGKCVYPVVIA